MRAEGLRIAMLTSLDWVELKGFVLSEIYSLLWFFFAGLLLNSEMFYRIVEKMNLKRMT